jgi:hypothetical protein
MRKRERRTNGCHLEHVLSTLSQSLPLQDIPIVRDASSLSEMSMRSALYNQTRSRQPWYPPAHTLAKIYDRDTRKEVFIFVAQKPEDEDRSMVREYKQRY